MQPEAEDDRIVGAIDCRALREAVAKLSERDRRVLFDYFIKGHTQSQIAADYDVGEMQVSRWITAAWRRLTNLLE